MLTLDLSRELWVLIGIPGLHRLHHGFSKQNTGLSIPPIRRRREVSAQCSRQDVGGPSALYAMHEESWHFQFCTEWRASTEV